MHRPGKVSWIVVADGHRARIFRQEEGGTLEPALDHDFVAPNPLDHDSGRDRPGRVHERMGYARHAFDGGDHHRARKVKFLTDLARKVDDAAMAGCFQRLVLVAPPRALGDLRAHLGSHAAGRLSGELALDLTHEPIATLAQRLLEVLP